MSIKVSQVSKFYNDQKALDEVSFTVNKGEVTGFLADMLPKDKLPRRYGGTLKDDDSEIPVPNIPRSRRRHRAWRRAHVAPAPDQRGAKDPGRARARL